MRVTESGSRRFESSSLAPTIEASASERMGVSVKLLVLFLTALLTAANAGQPAASESELRKAVQSAENLAQELRSGLKSYHDHLVAAMYRLGYTQYNPLFRTNLDGFSENQIDLEALDEFKMGRLAFELRSEGKQLAPDPFLDWAQVQSVVEEFPKTLETARKVVMRADIIDASSTENIPTDTFRKLRNRWRAALREASDSYDHARAVRAVQFENGAMVASPVSIRSIPGASPYAVACGFRMCSAK